MSDMRRLHPVGLTLTGLALIVGALAGCNMPQIRSSTTQNVDVTQVYQTVEARLTAAVTETPVVAASAVPTDSGLAVATDTQQPPTLTATSASAIQPTSAPEVCDLAAPGIPIDVTIPDDTQMQPGQAFTKVWRLKNAGTCTWQPDYQVFLFSGEAMGTPSTFSLGQQVSSGQSVEISVDMIAPQSAGTYQGNWKLRNPSGTAFGIGPNGNSSFWVRIVVVPLPTFTSTPATTTPTPTLTPTQPVQINGQVTIIPGETLDLDSNGVNLGSGEDLMYESTANGNHQLSPIGNVSLGLFGAIQPSMAECQAMTLQNQPLQVDKYVGQYFCYKTDLGLPGRGLIDQLNPDTYSLRLVILTWLMP
jgi:hypothetical protein